MREITLELKMDNTIVLESEEEAMGKIGREVKEVIPLPIEITLSIGAYCSHLTMGEFLKVKGLIDRAAGVMGV